MSDKKEKTIVLPTISHQADVGVLVTTEGERISVQDYEDLRVKYADQQNRPEPPVRDVYPVTENEAATIQYEDGKQLPREPEVHNSANVPGEKHGELKPNPDLSSEEGFVDRKAVRREDDGNGGTNTVTNEDGEDIADAAALQVEATPAVSVVRSGASARELDPIPAEDARRPEVVQREVPVAIAKQTPATKTDGKTEEDFAKDKNLKVAAAKPEVRDGDKIVAPKQDSKTTAKLDLPIEDLKKDINEKPTKAEKEAADFQDELNKKPVAIAKETPATQTSGVPSDEADVSAAKDSNKS